MSQEHQECMRTYVQAYLKTRNRQASIQTDDPTDRQAYPQTDEPNLFTSLQSNWHTDRRAYRQTSMHTDEQIGRHTNRPAFKITDKQDAN